jgi:hypothetical protein
VTSPHAHWGSASGFLTAFAISFGGVVLALALAFGRAGKEIARESLERLLRRRGPEDEDGLKHL